MSDIELLIQHLKHEDKNTRISAIKSLTKIADESSISALKDALQDDSVAVVRTATLAIGAIGGCEKISILEPLLEHQELWVRKAAVQAIGIANCQGAVPILVNLLGDNELNALVREALVALKVDPDFF